MSVKIDVGPLEAALEAAGPELKRRAGEALAKAVAELGPSRPARRRGVARLKIVAVLDRGGPSPGVLELDRGSKTIRVRPARSRRVYELPASLVASIICAKVIKADVAGLAAMHGKRPRVRARRGLR